MPSQNCKKCGHRWQSIVDKPLKCPQCNQPNYWKPKVRNVAPTPPRPPVRHGGASCEPGEKQK